MISIVIPLFNKELSISSTLQSVCAQTYTDFEVLVIDDGSTDAGGEIADFYPDERIRVIHKENGGVCSARNRGVQESRGDIIAFLDADDYWSPEYLETLVKLIEDYPHAGLWGLNFGTMTGDIKYQNPSSLYPGFRGIISNPWIKGSPFCSSAIGINKRAFEKVDGFDSRIIYGEDLDLWFRLMLEFPCAYEDKILCYYRIDAENRAMNRSFPLNVTLPFFIDKYSKFRKTNKDFRKYFDTQCLLRLFPYAVNGEYKYELKQILTQIDWSLQKWSMRFRFRFPHIYNFYRSLRGRKDV